VVFGRSDEAAGRYLAVTDVRAAGTPISLTSFDTATPGWTGPAGTDGAKVLGTRIALGPDVDGSPSMSPVDARTVVLHPDAGGAIATTLAATPDDARARLDAALPVTERALVPA